MGVIVPSKKMIRGWAMYDWANSAYNLVITSTIFPVYYDALTAVKDAGGTVISREVNLFGWQVQSGALYNYVIALAYLIIAFLSPILSSIADGRGNKKSFLKFFCYLGALACCLLYFFTKDNLVLGLLACIIAAIGYCGSLVFYNAYLPEIAPIELQDKVSAKGFAYGYIGSVLLQIICFVLVMVKPFGITDGMAARLSFLLVGLWWLGFAQMTFKALPPKIKRVGKQVTLWNNGLLELKKVLGKVNKMPILKRYLVAFFFYSTGVQTVMLAAALFGRQELGLSTTQLISCILVIQLVAIGGAQLMAWLSGKFGNIKVLIAVVLIWILICIIAYFIQTAMGFYVVATLVGIVMGGIQALSRSTYSKFMPETKDTTSYFSLYDVTEKVAIVLGTFSFGFILQITGSMRYSTLALGVFFMVGLILLWSVRNVSITAPATNK